MDKGYIFTKEMDTFDCNVQDLLPRSDYKVKVKCDYCGVEFEKQFKKYNKQREVIKKDCCSDKICKNAKSKDCNLMIYGTSSHTKTKKYKEESSKSQRMNFKLINKEFKKRGYILISKEKEYENNKTKLKFICLNHLKSGIMEIDWCHFVSSQSKGCKYCSREGTGWGFEKWITRSTSSKIFDGYKLYKIECFNKDETFYKIGITYQKIENRFSGATLPYNYKVIEVIESDSAKYIWDLEKKLHVKHKEAGLHYTPELEFGGYTECFSKLL